MANYKEKTTIFNGTSITIKPGQLITSCEKLAQKSKISRSTVDRILDWFENEQQIEQLKTNRYRVITILNWDNYQIREQPNEQPKRNQRGTKEEPKDTSKERRRKIKNVEVSGEAAKPEKPPLNENSKQADSQHDSNRVSGTTGIEEASAADNAIPLVIKMFEAVNPTVYKLYGNTTERSACERLLKLMPIDKLKIIITRVLPILNADKYAKGKSIKPSQLENNLGFVKAYIDQQQSTRLVHHVTE